MQGNFDFYLVRAIAFNLLHKIVVFRIFLKILFFSRMEILPVIANAVPDLFATIVWQVQKRKHHWISNRVVMMIVVNATRAGNDIQIIKNGNNNNRSKKNNKKKISHMWKVKLFL
jgi:hypothetical protein